MAIETDSVKSLFLAIIALIVPLFFTLIFVMSTYNRLAALRARCGRASAAIAMLRERRVALTSSSDQDAAGLQMDPAIKQLDQELASMVQGYNDLAGEYNQACRSFPG